MGLEACYAYIRKDQMQRQTMNVMDEPKPELDSIVNMATRNRNGKGKNGGGKNGNNFTCTHCGEEGHSNQRCYEIIGYPEWLDFNKKPRKKVGQASVATTPQVQEVSTPMAAHTSANASTTGKSQPHNSSWIIDTGATDHMTNSSDNLITLYPPKQSSIQTANGENEHVIAKAQYKFPTQ